MFISVNEMSPPLSGSLMIHMLMSNMELCICSICPLSFSLSLSFALSLSRSFHLSYLKLCCKFGTVNDYAYRPARRPHIEILWHD